MTTQKRGHEWRFSLVLIALMVTAFMLVSSAAAADAGPKFKGFDGVPPLVNFSTNGSLTGNDVTGTAPLTVQLFNNSTSTSPITAFEWSLSDGRKFNNEHPVVTFTTPGTYYVTLKVTNATGWMSNISGNSPTGSSYVMPKIVVNPTGTGTPVFTFTPASGPLSLDFPYTFKAVQTAGQTPTTWVWNWGDGTASTTGAEVTHTFTGTPHADHIVTLTGTNAAGSAIVSNTYTIGTLAAPVAKFKQNLTDTEADATGVAPLPVLFTSLSTGGVTTYAWNFGGAGTSTKENPEFVFSTPGNYNVTLTASNAAGSSTAFHWVNTTVPTKPGILFKAVGAGTTAWGETAIPTSSALESSSPFEVAFTDYSVNYSQEQGNGTPTSWLWDFGDGSQPSSTRNLTHTFSTLGTYTVRLTATNSGGSNSSWMNITVTAPVLPAAKIAINNTELNSGNSYTFAGEILTGETVNFGSISDNNPTSYKWVFSDNPSVTYSTDRNTTKSFANAGDYFVMLTATNSKGSTTTTGYFTVDASASGNAPVAKFFMNNGTQNVTVNANGVTFNPVNQIKPVTVALKNFSDNAPTSFQWFIDGALVSTEPTYTATFDTAKVYTINFRATNSHGSNEVSTTVTVVEPGAIPEAIWEVNPASGTAPAPATVTFTDKSTNSPTSWFWNFDDGTTSNEQSPVHTFTQPGNYSVTLIATNSVGSSIPVQTIYQVKTLQAPVANFTASSGAVTKAAALDTEIEGPMPFEVNFTSTSTMNPTSVLWHITGTGVDVTKTTNTFNYTFNNPGKYSVQLIAYNAAGQNTIFKSAFVNVTTAAPVPNFTWTPTSPIKGQAVQFTDTTLYGPTGWAWSFGDGGLSSIQNPSHTYANAGTYTVTLTTWNSVPNSQKTVTKTITVADLAPPVANFTWSPEEPKVGDVVTFTDTSTNNPTSWTWGIDNNVYTTQNPSVTFTTAGPKIAFLVATNAAGPSTAKMVTINVAEVPVTVTPTPEVPIVADFTMTPDSGVAPLTVQFASTSTGPYTTLDWTILLGEEVVDSMVGETPSFTFANPGTYTVLLEASNSGTGEVATKEQTVTVTETPVTTITTTTTTQTPIGGNQPYPSAHVMPGRVEAEDYDVTAGYPAYSDTTAANEGGAYRQDAVDIEVGGSNYNVGWIRPTEFLTYSVDVPTGAAGAYTIAFRMANPSGAKSFNVFVDGVSVGTVNLPATGSFNTWTTVQTPSVQMTEGRHVIKVDFPSTTSINFDYMDIQGGAPVTTTTTVVTTTTTAQPTTGGATFTAAPIPVKKSSAIKFTVTPAPGKTIKSAWWTFDKVNHYNTWNSRTINPTFYYPAVGTYTPLVILTYTDGTTQTVEKASYVQVIA